MGVHFAVEPLPREMSYNVLQNRFAELEDFNPTCERRNVNLTCFGFICYNNGR